MHRSSQLIASAGSSFVFTNESRSIVLHFIKQFDVSEVLRKIRTNIPHPGNSLTLHFENIKGSDVYPVIDIYMNLEKEDSPSAAKYVGSMALFGVKQSSAVSGNKEGAGQHRVWDADEVMKRVSSQPDWSNDHFRLTLIPNGVLRKDSKLLISKIALYYTES